MGVERTMTNGMKNAGVTAGPLAPGQRWSLSRKREVVLRILKCESIGGEDKHSNAFPVRSDASDPTRLHPRRRQNPH